MTYERPHYRYICLSVCWSFNVKCLSFNVTMENWKLMLNAIISLDCVRVCVKGDLNVASSLLIVPQLWKSQIGMGQFIEIIGTYLGNRPSQMYNRSNYVFSSRIGIKFWPAMWLLSIVLSYQKEYNLIASYKVSYYHYCMSCKTVARHFKNLFG